MVYGPPELHALIPSCAKLTGMALTTPVAVMGWVLDPARAHQPRLVEGMPLLAVGLVGPDQGQQLSEARPGLAEEWQAEYDSGSDKVWRGSAMQGMQGLHHMCVSKCRAASMGQSMARTHADYERPWLWRVTFRGRPGPRQATVRQA